MLLYTITLIKDNGEGKKKIVEYYDGSIDEPEEPKKTGYKFLGWYEDESTESYIFDRVEARDIELTAIWEKLQYTITLIKDNGEETTDITKYYDSKVSTPKAPEKTGHRFLGWYEYGAINSYIFDRIEARDIELTARWEKKTYNVSYFGPDNVLLFSESIVYGEAVEEKTYVTNSGYLFEGWIYDDNFFDFATIISESIELYVKVHIKNITHLEFGKGTVYEPYLIYNAIQLMYLSNYVRSNKDGNLGYSGVYFALAGDIDCSLFEEFAPIGSESNPFRGYFNGNNFEIRNLIISKSYSRIGLFGCISGSEIVNLRIENAVIDSTVYTVVVGAGILCGEAINSSIENVIVQGKISVDSYSMLSVGGIVGMLMDYSKCYSAKFSGSLVARNFQTQTYSTYAGGIAGYAVNGDVYYSANYGDILGYSEHYFADAGGIIGFSSRGDIFACYNTGSVGAETVYYQAAFVGGICASIGYVNSVQYCYNAGRLYAFADRVMMGDVIGADYESDNIIKNNYYFENINLLNGVQKNTNWCGAIFVGGVYYYEEGAYEGVNYYPNSLILAENIYKRASYAEFGEYSDVYDMKDDINYKNAWVFKDGQMPELFWEAAV